MRVPETKKTDLEKIEEEIESETEEWKKIGMHANMTQHSNESIWMLKVQVQSMMNMILKLEICTQEQLNLEFKQLVLNDMRLLRKEAQAQKEQMLVPQFPLLGPDGKPVKI